MYRSTASLCTDVFHHDPEFMANEDKYKLIKEGELHVVCIKLKHVNVHVYINTRLVSRKVYILNISCVCFRDPW